MSPDDIRTRSEGDPTVTPFPTAPVPGTPHVIHDWDSTDSMLLQIIETVADETGKPQEEMQPLYSVLDVDALERLLTGDGAPVQITFSYEGCSIVASNDGTVVVQPER